MNVSSASNQDIFDVRKIRRLVELMKEHDLSEIDLQQGEVRIQLRRAATAGQPAMRPSPAPQRCRCRRRVRRPPESARRWPPEAKAGGIALIKSPMVGTFYAAPDPDSPPFVKVGDHVGPETTVCIVEAMKVFNQIPAEISGRIIAVLAENGAGGVWAAVVQGRYAGVAVFKRILRCQSRRNRLAHLSCLPGAGRRNVAMFSEADRGAAYLDWPTRRIASGRPRPPTAI